MNKTSFSSDELPPGLGDGRRFSLWREVYEATYTAFEFSRSLDRPFFARFEFAQFGQVGLARFHAAINGVSRGNAQIAKHPRDHLCLALPGEGCTIMQSQSGREERFDSGGALLTNEAVPAEFRMPNGSSWILLNFPREVLIERIPAAEDLVARRLACSPQATAHLRRYANLLLEDAHDMEEPLASRVGNTLIEFAELIFTEWPKRDEDSQARGLRMARLRDILLAVGKNYADPAFFTEDLATSVGLSRRYVNELLHESGQGFTERILELRLQKARALIADARNDRMKIGEIALACGFNDVSYFNRRFRARFGCSPSQYRSGQGMG